MHALRHATMNTMHAESRKGHAGIRAVLPKHARPDSAGLTEDEKIFSSAGSPDGRTDAAAERIRPAKPKENCRGRNARMKKPRQISPALLDRSG